MKKVLCLLLCVVMLASFGCGKQAEPPVETTAPAPTQSPEEEKTLTLLVIGNSAANDTFWQLYEGFQAQAPEQEVMIGILYYSGCTIAQHVQFAQGNQAVYEYYRNSAGRWETVTEVRMQEALRDQKWDIVILQPGKNLKEYDKELRDPLIEFVDQHVQKTYQLYWHHTSPNPNDEKFYAPDHDPQPPSGYRQKLIDQYGFDPVNQMKICYGLMEEEVLGDERFEKFISTGTATAYALFVGNVPQTEIFRDYTHLTDYGRLIASYALYTQITGDVITEVKVDSVAAGLRNRRAQVLGDMEVTPEMKQMVLDAVTYAQKNTWTIPGQE